MAGTFGVTDLTDWGFSTFANDANQPVFNGTAETGDYDTLMFYTVSSGDDTIEFEIGVWPDASMTATTVDVAAINLTDANKVAGKASITLSSASDGFIGSAQVALTATAGDVLVLAVGAMNGAINVLTNGYTETGGQRTTALLSAALPAVGSSVTLDATHYQWWAVNATITASGGGGGSTTHGALLSQFRNRRVIS